MAGPSGNRQIYLPLEIQDRLPKAAPPSIETLGEAILNLLGQIDLPITFETSHYLFSIIWWTGNTTLETATI